MFVLCWIHTHARTLDAQASLDSKSLLLLSSSSSSPVLHSISFALSRTLTFSRYNIYIYTHTLIFTCACAYVRDDACVCALWMNGHREVQLNKALYHVVEWHNFLDIPIVLSRTLSTLIMGLEGCLNALKISQFYRFAFAHQLAVQAIGTRCACVHAHSRYTHSTEYVSWMMWNWTAATKITSVVCVFYLSPFVLFFCSVIKRTKWDRSLNDFLPHIHKKRAKKNKQKQTNDSKRKKKCVKTTRITM